MINPHVSSPTSTRCASGSFETSRFGSEDDGVAAGVSAVWSGDTPGVPIGVWIDCGASEAGLGKMARGGSASIDITTVMIVSWLVDAERLDHTVAKFSSALCKGGCETYHQLPPSPLRYQSWQCKISKQPSFPT
jgi:hypothetical protein